MRRRSNTNEESQDYDSFLDIVANIVGILVILVVVVTARARQVPEMSISAGPSRAEEIKLALRESTSLEADVKSMDGALQHLEQELENRVTERNYMATLVAAAEDQIAREREQLDGQDQEEYDLRNQLAMETAQLERTRQTLDSAANSPTSVIQLESYPTPLGKTVFGKEVHFRLLEGRIAYVPVEELIEEVKGDGRARLWKLDGELTEVTETAGPIDGFRIRYTMERVEIPVEQRIKTGRTGHIVQLKSFELVPVGRQLGEPVERAYQPGSRFQRTLAELDKQRTTVTLWVYPDSFASFRMLKKFLFEQGYATAARPLVPGVLIGGSPRGTRSSAE